MACLCRPKRSSGRKVSAREGRAGGGGDRAGQACPALSFTERPDCGRRRWCSRCSPETHRLAAGGSLLSRARYARQAARRHDPVITGTATRSSPPGRTLPRSGHPGTPSVGSRTTTLRDPRPTRKTSSTKAFIAAGKLLDITVEDHVVLGTNAWVSMKRERMAFCRESRKSKAKVEVVRGE